jgi:hypothetical protein
MPDGGYARTEFDGLTLPGGKKPQDYGSGQLASLLVNAGVEGASHEKGRSDNLAAYAKHLDGIRKVAADKAVSDWVASK